MLLFCIVPTATGVMVAVPPGTIFAKSSLTLTCTVDLPPSVDIPVTVVTVWSEPLTTINPVTMESLTRYTSTAIVSLNHTDIGNHTYSCTATQISLVSPYLIESAMAIGSVTITVGELSLLHLYL